MDAFPIYKFYRILLRIFPRSFYAEFHEEMQAVFSDVLAEAAERGRMAWLAATLNEMLSLPVEALRLHLAAHSINLPGARSTGWEGPPTRKESWLALVAFTLPVLGLYYRESILQSARLPVYLAAGLVLGVVLAGFLKGFPRWSLPYLGIVLSTACFFLLVECKADELFPLAMKQVGIVPQDESARLVFEALWSGLLWLSLFAVTLLGLSLLALLRRCQVMLQRIRQDWTLASYILYTGILTALGLSFSRHISQEFFAVASLVCLGAGGWLFLRSPRPWQRVLALVGGLTLAVLVAFAGRSPLHPLETWAMVLPLEVESHSKSVLVLLEWAWLAALLVAPVFLRFIPRCSRKREISP